MRPAPHGRDATQSRAEGAPPLFRLRRPRRSAHSRRSCDHRNFLAGHGFTPAKAPPVRPSATADRKTAIAKAMPAHAVLRHLSQPNATSDATASSPAAAHFARKGFMDELSQQLPRHKCKQEELL